MNIGFVGLGVMGFPMAGHLRTAGQAGAVNGVLTIMVGGEATAFARVEPVLNVYAKCVRLWFWPRRPYMGLSLPVTSLVNSYYADVQAMGGGIRRVCWRVCC